MSYFTDGIDRKYKITDKTAFKPISTYSKTAGYKVNIDKSVAMHQQQQAEIEFKTIFKNNINTQNEVLRYKYICVIYLRKITKLQ